MKKIEDLIEKNGIYYEKNTNIPYNGKVIGSATGLFKNGLPDGKWKEFSSKGILMSESNYVKGKLNGQFINYFENGKLEKKEVYKNGFNLSGSYH